MRRTPTAPTTTTSTAARCAAAASSRTSQRADDVQVHHVRKLADLDTPGTHQAQWATIMANRRRKTLIVCAACHDHIHTGQPAPLAQ
jgi:hypothetical protein